MWLYHRVYEPCQAKEFTLERAPIHFALDRLAKVTFGYRADRSRNLSCRSDQVVQQRVEAIDFGRPLTDRPGNRHPLLEPPLAANSPAQALDFEIGRASCRERV